MLRHITQFRYISRSLTQTFASGSQNKPPQEQNDQEPVQIIDFEDPDYLPLPVYPDRPDEPLEQRKQRLLYQSRKRGMLENDLLLSTFAAKYLKSMTAEQTALYDKLINGPTNDWDIYYWATEVKPIPDEYKSEIMDMFKMHVRNLDKEVRLRQPEINSN